ncbi:MAG: NRDE family protein [Casimicrobiaceae bacterium]|nr:NRDE family protein [Casimicrobiaceae bacterium]
MEACASVVRALACLQTRRAADSRRASAAVAVLQQASASDRDPEPQQLAQNARACASPCFAGRPAQRSRFFLAANRDEYRARPAQPLARWSDGNIVAGRDLARGGTWLALSPRPTHRGEPAGLRFGFVTNVRSARPRKAGAPSRGTLVPSFLLGADTPLEFAVRLAREAGAFDEFNLLLGEISPRAVELAFLHSPSGAARRLGPGLYGVSNANLDTPWPKLVRLKQALAHALAPSQRAERDQRLLRVLADTQRAPDAALPSTGVPLDWERALSAIFIDRAEYGTRCSSLVSIEASSRARFFERTWHRNDRPSDVEIVLPP